MDRKIKSSRFCLVTRQSAVYDGKLRLFFNGSLNVYTINPNKSYASFAGENLSPKVIELINVVLYFYNMNIKTVFDKVYLCSFVYYLNIISSIL